MRFIWLIFVGLLAAMAIVLPRLNRAPTPPAASSSAAQLPVRPAMLRASGPISPKVAARADSIVAFGLAQQGTPYVWAGTSPLTGFDCSGFIMYTFAHFGVAVPHSTALLIDAGRPVARAEAQPGDIVVFTGTAETSTSAGHAGIVISRRGEVPLRFVHASSSRREPFVKVNQVEGSDYERRFMQVRRVLGPGQVATVRPRLPIPASTAAPVGRLPARRVTVAAATPAVELPIKLAPRKAAKRAITHRKPVAKATAAKKAVANKKPIVKKKATAAKKPVVKKKTTVAKRKAATAKKAVPARKPTTHSR